MLTVTVCAALTAAGLAIAFLTAWRRRFVAATRIAAVALLPLGLALSGLLALGGQVARAAGSWAADLVLDPRVWAGFAVLAVAVVLFVAAGFAGARSRSRRPTAGAEAAPAGRERPAATAGPDRTQAAPAPKRQGGGEDFSEIEEILKKHGI
ncbi:hypothetical protein WDH52_13405 [Streptomyces sp. TRM70308]|uniref:hypothetical protein n=1 Tax=Streptomyces sp. TRM70308 TaxID=3131932 RepID=UPI003CFE96D5